MNASLADLGAYGLLNALTTAVHWAFVNYVVIGACAVLRGSVARAEESRLETTLRDWLPFALSGLITAGVAPLLFTQLVRPVRYPSAAGLLQHSYMAILPVLIACFYLLYVLKGADGPRRRGRRIWTSAACVAGFVFIGWTISRNHVLSLRPDLWADVYAGRAEPPERAVAWRTAAWLAWSTASFCVLARLQLGRGGAPDRAFATTALAALSVAVPATYFAVRATYGAADVPLAFGVAGAGGVALQAAAWTAVRRGRDGAASRVALPAGLAITLATAALFREFAALDRRGLDPFGAESPPTLADSQGFGLFVVCLTLTTGAAIVAVRIARRAAPRA